MSATSYGVNAPESNKLWSKRLAREALKATWCSKFIGDSDDSLIQTRKETSKDAGDQITITLRMQLTGDGVQGDNTLEGNEEALTTYTDKILIDQLRHAVRSKGKMSEQRIPWSIRSEANSGLRDWWAGRIDTWFFNQICGNTAVLDTRYTGNQAVLAPTLFQRAGSLGTDELVQADITKTFDLHLIDQAVAVAKTQTPVMRPIKFQGEDLFVGFLHPFQVRDIRTNTATGQWTDIQKAVLAGGMKDSPIFQGALGMYNNVVLHESVRVTNGVHSTTGAVQASTRRAVIGGAQSCAVAFGQGDSFDSFNWEEELFDFGNQLGVGAGCIGGLKKLQFNAKDFSTIVLTTYAA